MIAMVGHKPKFATLAPLASLAERRAAPKDQEAWNDEQRTLRTCQWCHTPYKSGGDAGACEKNHEGLLGL